MKRFANLITVTVALTTIFSLLFTPGCAKKSPESTKVRVGYLPITADIPLFVAIEKGYYKKYGIEVEPIKFASANEAMDALMAGRSDSSIMIGFSTLFSIYEKDSTQFKIYQSAAETADKFTCRLLVRKDSDISSIPQLKGKKIGTYSGLTQLLNLKSVLEKFLDPDKDVTIIQVETKIQLQAFAAGQFYALFTIDPYSTIALENGTAKVLVDNPRFKYILSPFPTCASVFSNEFLRKYPRLAKGIILAENEAVDFIEANPSESAKLVSKYTPVEEGIALKCGTYEWWKLGNEDKAVVQKLSDIFVSQGALKNKINSSDMFVSEKVLE